MPESAAPHRLKVLHTMTWLAPGGGADTNVLLSIRGQRASGHYDLHFTTGPEIFHNEFAHEPELTIHYCPHLYRPIRPWKDVKSLWYYYRLMRRERFDIVHTHEAKASLIGRVAAWLAGVPVIIFGLHGVAYNDPAFSKRKRRLFIWLERLTVWPSEMIVSVSQSCLDHYRADGIGRKLNSRVVYSGIDVARFDANSQIAPEERLAERAALGFGPEDVVLINVGRFTYGKAQRHTIEAFAKLKPDFPHLKLLLVGEGDLLDDCSQQVQQLGLQHDVVFYGFTENIPRVMALADINVLTSLREGLPRVVVEASLCGLPTTAFDVEGLREIIHDGESGCVVPQLDVAALAGRIRALVLDPDLRRTFAAKAGAHARAHWDSATMVHQLDEIYLQLAKRHVKWYRRLVQAAG
jgi:glycosyltransferase involved in cell wall biosynthesis